jgi:hypothetical protein
MSSFKINNIINNISNENILIKNSTIESKIESTIYSIINYENNTQNVDIKNNKKSKEKNIITKNEKIINFYKNNQNISIEDMNLLFIKLYEEYAKDEME